MKAYTCYRLTAVTVILINPEFSLLNVFFQSYYREQNDYATMQVIVEPMKYMYMRDHPNLIVSYLMEASWFQVQTSKVGTCIKLENNKMCFHTCFMIILS